MLCEGILTSVRMSEFSYADKRQQLINAVSTLKRVRQLYHSPFTTFSL